MGPSTYILLSCTAFEEEKRQNFEVVADMTRQYKTMREELLIKINALEEKCTQLQDKVGAARRVHTPWSWFVQHHLIDRVLSATVVIPLSFCAPPEQAAREAAESERRNNQALQLKDAEIIEHRQKMDDMAVEFSQMLKLTLEKMSEKVAVTSDLLSNRRLDDL